jgi:hypothetical protein
MREKSSVRHESNYQCLCFSTSCFQTFQEGVNIKIPFYSAGNLLLTGEGTIQIHSHYTYERYPVEYLALLSFCALKNISIDIFINFTSALMRS